jgi:hypothetical protein
MDKLIANLKEFVFQQHSTIMLPCRGHRTQRERAAEVNAAIVDFLRQL